MYQKPSIAERFSDLVGLITEGFEFLLAKEDLRTRPAFAQADGPPLQGRPELRRPAGDGQAQSHGRGAHGERGRFCQGGRGDPRHDPVPRGGALQRREGLYRLLAHSPHITARSTPRCCCSISGRRRHCPRCKTCKAQSRSCTSATRTRAPPLPPEEVAAGQGRGGRCRRRRAEEPPTEDTAKRGRAAGRAPAE